MARDFDGNTDSISFGSDASIDGFTARTVALWVRKDAASGTYQDFANKITSANGWNFSVQSTSNKLELAMGFSGGPGFWETTSYALDGNLHQIVYTYTGLAANDPLFYADGASQGVTETGTPSGTRNTDAASNLVVGIDNGGLGDWDGVIGFFCYDNTAWDAATVNRHRWWGCAPGGPSTVDVWQPMWTSDLTNKGTATANGTATGTTMASLPKVERMWGSMMGCGR